jgi:L-aminopeptidase/D-esterase-like protein
VRIPRDAHLFLIGVQENGTHALHHAAETEHSANTAHRQNSTQSPEYRPAQGSSMQDIDITSVGGFAYANYTDDAGGTGATVFLFDHLSPAGVAIRGGGPASRETPLLAPVASSSGIHALMLSGGSAYGLDAAGGVMRFLEEQGTGLHIREACVPLVCQSCLFDLPVGDQHARPNAQNAYDACFQAKRSVFQNGNIGAGTGCSVGKYHGMEHAMKGGLGSYAVQVGQVKIGAVVAVNAMGDVYAAGSGTTLAGMLDDTNTAFESSFSSMIEDMESERHAPEGNTTIGAVFTNAGLDKSALTKIASMAHNGYARTIRPVHTRVDGDSVYAVSTGSVVADADGVGTLAAYVMERAVEVAVLSAESAYGLPCAKDFVD